MHDLLLIFAARNIYDVGMAQSGPFEGLGAALIRLRERAGFSRQTEAAETLKIDKGQLSRWENENPRPTLENLGRLLAGYGATVGDLAVELGVAVVPPAATEAKSAPAAEGVGGGSAEKRVPTDEELIRSLAEAIRRVEGRQVETESRMERIVERIGGLG
jgi:transcriptional regulator with XRE-family HTH domain